MSESLRDLLMDDILLNIFEFLDRSYVVENISTCSKYFNQVCHKPYHYNRLVWTFSEQYYAKLKRIKHYYTKVQTIEMSDSNKFIESTIQEKRIDEFIEYLMEHKDSIKRLNLNFNRNQSQLLNKIVETCHEWLNEISISILLDTEFVKYTCSQLYLFKHLKVLKLIVSNSIEADLILNSCEMVLNNGILETFISTLFLRNEDHVRKFIHSVKQSTLRNLSFSLNCESLEDEELSDELIECLNNRNIINIKLFNVSLIEFVNKFKLASESCKEFNVSIVTMKNHQSNESIELKNVYDFSIETRNFTPNLNSFPIHVRNLKVSLYSPSKITSPSAFPSINNEFGERYQNLTKIELNTFNIDIQMQNRIPNLEVVHFENGEVTSVGSILEFSHKLKIVKCLNCKFKEETTSIDIKLYHLRELTLKDCTGKHFHLSALKNLNLESLTCTYNHANDEQYVNLIEEMTELEYFHIDSTTNCFLTNFKFDKLTCLKYFIYKNPHYDYETRNFANISSSHHLLRNCFIIIGEHVMSLFTSLKPNLDKPNISDKTIDKAIIDLNPTLEKEISVNNGCIHYILFDDNILYVFFYIGKHPGFVLLENKPPYKVITGKLSKIELQYTRKQYFVRRISIPSKCIIN